MLSEIKACLFQNILLPYILSKYSSLDFETTVFQDNRASKLVIITKTKDCWHLWSISFISIQNPSKDHFGHPLLQAVASFISIQNLSFSHPLLGAVEAWEVVRHEVPMVLHRPHAQMVDDDDDDDSDDGDDGADGFT